MEKTPAIFTKVLSANSRAKAQWNSLTPIARRDFTRWMTSAKQQETRDHRALRACDMLAKGKRRPCCYNIVPMNLYGALGLNAKARDQWKTLTPDERRDFVDWLDAAKKGEGADRVEKICKLLASGKRSV